MSVTPNARPWIYHACPFRSRCFQNMSITDYMRMTKHRKGLGRRVLLNYGAHLLIIRCAVLLEEVESVCLRRRLRVWLVEQRLDTQQDLLDCDSRLPAFLLVEDREADGAGGVDVGVEERRDEFAWIVSECVDLESRVVIAQCCSLEVGAHVHFGGLVGYSSGKVTSSLKRPPSQMVFSLPGTPQSHFLSSIMPFAPRIGLAKKPNGWSRRHCFLDIPSARARGSSPPLAYLSSERRFIHSDILWLQGYRQP